MTNRIISGGQTQAALTTATDLLRELSTEIISATGCALPGCSWGDGRPHKHWCPMPRVAAFLAEQSKEKE